MSRIFSGKVLLAVLVVTAATGGFTLGYLVGKNVSSSPPSLSVRQQLNDGGSVPQSPAPGQGPAGEGSSAAVPVVPNPPLETRQPDIAPSATQKPSAKDEAGNTKLEGSSGAQTPPGSDGRKPSPNKKGLSVQPAVSRTARPADQPETASSAYQGEKEVPDPAAISAGKVLYTVQAGAFKNRKDAEALKRKLVAKKYKTSVKKEANARGVVFFKVRTGEFESKKEASALALELKDTDGLNAFAVAKK